MELTVPLDTVCRLIIRARELEAQVPAIQTSADDDPTDSDDPFAAIEDESNEAVEAEVSSLLDDLGEDEVAEVLALAMVGRGTFDTSEWDEALEAAGEDGPQEAIAQLMDMPMLSAYLDAGLTAFDLSCEGLGQID